MNQSRNSEMYFPLHHYPSISSVQQGGAVALFKTLNQGKKGRAFLSFGVAAHYNRSIYEDEHGQVHISNGDDESYGLIFGPGVGLERWFAENFAVSLEIPAAIRVDSDEGFSILPIPNCALAYRW